MGAKNEGLARRFEEKILETRALLEKLSGSDWKKVTAAEKWSVGVTAHHLAGDLEPIAEMVAAVAAGKKLNFTKEMIDEMNAKHSKDYVNCTRAETIETLKKGAAAAGAVIRGLSDEQLAKSGVVMAGMPPMTAEQLITLALIDHFDEHLASIRKTVEN